jgi:hypothetical protein
MAGGEGASGGAAEYLEFDIWVRVGARHDATSTTYLHSMAAPRCMRSFLGPVKRVKVRQWRQLRWMHD